MNNPNWRSVLNLENFHHLSRHDIILALYVIYTLCYSCIYIKILSVRNTIVIKSNIFDILCSQVSTCPKPDSQKSQIYFVYEIAMFELVNDYFEKKNISNFDRSRKV